MKENVEYFYNLGVRKTFLSITWNPETIKQEIDRFNSIKNKNIYKGKSDHKQS